MAVRIELVLTDFAAEGIPVDSERFGGTGLVAVFAVQYALDKTLLEFANRFVEQNTAFDHLIHKPFQLIFHDVTLREESCWVGRLLVQVVPGQDAKRLPVLGTRGSHNLVG